MGKECVRKRCWLLLGSSCLGWRNVWFFFHKHAYETSESERWSLLLHFWPTWQTDQEREVVLQSGGGWCGANVLLSRILAKEEIINVLWFKRIYPDAWDDSLGPGHEAASSLLVWEEWDTGISGGGDHAGNDGIHSSWVNSKRRQIQRGVEKEMKQVDLLSKVSLSVELGGL